MPDSPFGETIRRLIPRDEPRLVRDTFEHGTGGGPVGQPQPQAQPQPGGAVNQLLRQLTGSMISGPEASRLSEIFAGAKIPRAGVQQLDDELDLEQLLFLFEMLSSPGSRDFLQRQRR